MNTISIFRVWESIAWDRIATLFRLWENIVWDRIATLPPIINTVHNNYYRNACITQVASVTSLVFLLARS